MKTVNRIKALLAPLLSALSDAVYNGSIGFFNKKLYVGADSAWKELAYSDDMTLDNVTAKGNYTALPIIVHRYSSGGSFINEAVLGFNATTYSMYYGNFRNDSTGTYNLAIGYNVFKNLTSGKSNSALGSNAGKALTTGNFSTFVGYSSGDKATTGNSNTFVGVESGAGTTTGFKNTFLGSASGFTTSTGNLNIVIGYKAGTNGTLGDRNIIIGTAAAQIMTGNNNIIVGNAAGSLETSLQNKLIIHNNDSFTGYNNLSEGNINTPQKSSLANALITGDFVEQWVKINGNFIMNTGYLPNSVDIAAYTDLISYNPTTGVFGKRSIASVKKTYKVYTAIMNFNGTTFEPDGFKILENDIGSIVWTRISMGSYRGTLVGAFPVNKTFLNAQINILGGGGSVTTFAVVSDFIQVDLFSLGDPYEAGGSVGFLEIRVYP